MLANDSIQSMGGKARAEALSPEERSQIATAAAEARWKAPKATHKGVLTIGEVRIPCAVLEDGKRVLSENGITNAILGSRSGASKRLKKAAESDGTLLPLFLAPSNLSNLVDESLRAGPLRPINYQDGRSLERGYEAELLPAVCDVWLKAREKGLLQRQQLDKAQKAEILMRALAHVGITALVDEATGYQEVRDRLALQAILERYIKDEWAKWTRRFPSDFYRHLFRLKGIPFPPSAGTQKPMYVGHWTNDVVYSRLGPGILKKLREVNPKVTPGHRARKHHQHLTEDVGVPELQQLLSNVIFLMKGCTSWNEFKQRLDISAPKYGDTMSLPLEPVDDRRKSPDLKAASF
jgi:hypothetical protein